MKYIQKNKRTEPASLKAHRLRSHANYDNSPKDDIRLALLKEQGYLCCYCMQRISQPDKSKMKIEHFLSQTANPDKELDYTNMLAACKGNEGFPLELQHCDTAKGENKISIDPRNRQMMSQIKFDKEGRVFSTNEQHNVDIDKTLHLNLDFLKQARAAIRKGIEQKVKQKYRNARPNKSFIQELLKHWQSFDKNGMLAPYCQVAIYVLEKELKRSL